jgi:hypothetical protein
MIGRRALPLLLATPALAQPASRYRWRVMREGSAIGTHNVGFTERGAERVALSELVVTPTVLGVVVYRYEHRYTEVTERGRFVSVRSRLNRNGRLVEVEAEASGDGVLVRGPEGALRLPAAAAPLSWWEPQRFGGPVPLFGTTTGKAIDLGWTREARAGGGVTWRTRGEIEAVVGFDAAGRWASYQVKGDDGSLVSYAPA